MPDTSLTDPLKRKIALHDFTWFGHIVKGHPEMKGRRSLVESAVRHPKEIWISCSDPDCRLYFGKGPRAGLLTLVVADVVRGFVKTAHLARRVSGRTREW